MKQLYIFKSLLNLIARYVMDFKGLETGGSLFGNYTRNGSAVIHYITGPGPKSIHQVSKFLPDLEYLQKHSQVISKYGLVHLGDYHSHHKLGLEKPSTGDVNGVKSGLDHIRENAQDGIVAYEMGIATIQKGKPNLRFFKFDNNLQYSEPEVIVIDEKAPLFGVIQYYLPEECIIEPKTTKAKIENLTTLSDSIEGAWFTTLEGKAYITNIIHSIQALSPLELQLTNGNFKIVSTGLNLQIIFPSTFPKHRPKVYINGKKKSVKALLKYQPEIQFPSF